MTNEEWNACSPGRKNQEIRDVKTGLIKDSGERQEFSSTPQVLARDAFESVVADDIGQNSRVMCVSFRCYKAHPIDFDGHAHRIGNASGFSDHEGLSERDP